MKYKLILHELAIEEAKEAYEYYEIKQIGLGERFNNEVEKRIEIIQNNPKHFRKFKKDIRQLKIDIFPYVLVYKILGETILLQCIFHTSRNPKLKIRD